MRTKAFAGKTFVCRLITTPVPFKLFIFSFFLFYSIFISPRAVAEDFCSSDCVDAPFTSLPEINGSAAAMLAYAPPSFEDSLQVDDSQKDGNETRKTPQKPTPPTPLERFAPGAVLPQGLQSNLPDITRGPKDRMELSITFDGGGYEDNEALEILKVLRDRGIKTTIFLTGLFIKKYPWIVKEIVRDGHEVGNHTLDHPHLTEFAGRFTQKTLKGVDRKFVERELKETAALFKEATGTDMAPLWRAPYGEENAEIRRWAFDAGYAHVYWTYGKNKESLDTLDWVDDASSRLYRSSQEIKKRILKFGRNGDGVNGGIILMHLSTGRKTDRPSSMLGELIDDLMKRGYRFVKVSELVRNDRTLDKRIVKAMERRGFYEKTGVEQPHRLPGMANIDPETKGD